MTPKLRKFQTANVQKNLNDKNLHIAIFGLLICSLASAGFTAYVCDFVLRSFQDSNCMALIITDTGIASDDARLEHQLSQAGQALAIARDFGMALAMGVFGVGVALVIRIRR